MIMLYQKGFIILMAICCVRSNVYGIYELTEDDKKTITKHTEDQKIIKAEYDVSDATSGVRLMSGKYYRHIDAIFIFEAGKDTTSQAYAKVGTLSNNVALEKYKFDKAARYNVWFLLTSRGDDPMSTMSGDEFRFHYMDEMFLECTSLVSIDFSLFNASKIILMQKMFQDCTRLTNINFTNFNTKNVTSMRNMFYGCSSLIDLDLSSFDTSSVHSMSGMFVRCKSLTTLDLSNFNTSKVESMEYMFYLCEKLRIVNIQSFVFTSVTSMENMFDSCADIESILTSSSVQSPTKKCKCGGILKKCTKFRNCNSIASFEDWKNAIQSTNPGLPNKGNNKSCLCC